MPNGSNGHRIDRLEGEVAEVKDDVGKLKEAAVEHRMRLQNGTKVFEGWDKRIGDIEKRITPKPPSITKVAGISLSIFLAFAAALWGLAHMLRDRPTADQLEDLFMKQGEHHEAVGHKGMRQDIQAIQREQTEQRIMIKSVADEQKTHSEKLDKLLRRIPERRSRTPR
jgi:hypothetical protein